MQRTDSLGKTLIMGKIEGRRRRGQQDEMTGWHHQLDGHEFEQAPGVGDRQGSLACCSPWGHKDPDTTEQLNWLTLLFYSTWYSRITLYFSCLRLGFSQGIQSYSNKPRSLALFIGNWDRTLGMCIFIAVRLIVSRLFSRQI